jgi:hypothetical protein
MLNGIEFYFKPEEQVEFSRIKKPNILGDFHDKISEKDRKIIESEWAVLIS